MTLRGQMLNEVAADYDEFCAWYRKEVISGAHKAEAPNAVKTAKSAAKRKVEEDSSENSNSDSDESPGTKRSKPVSKWAKKRKEAAAERAAVSKLQKIVLTGLMSAPRWL